MFKKYQSLKRKLGVRPHELLVAQFLARIAPIMDMRPQTKLLLEESSLSSRKTIRDRFFDKEWSLNPNKERVHQIFGEDNRWLEPEAIKARRNELRRQNSGSFF